MGFPTATEKRQGLFRLLRNDSQPASSEDSNEATKREFERLYRESYPVVYGFVRTRMNDEAAAEDIVSDAYILAARSFGKFDPTRAKFSTWVITIAKNCMINYFRKNRPAATLDEVPESAFAEEANFDALADCELVLQLLALLSDEEREMVLLKYRDGLRNVEIAEQLGMNASTVSTMLSRALAKMRSAAERSV